VAASAASRFDRLVFFIAVGEIYFVAVLPRATRLELCVCVPILWATMNATMVAMMSYWLGPRICNAARG